MPRATVAKVQNLIKYSDDLSQAVWNKSAGVSASYDAVAGVSTITVAGLGNSNITQFVQVAVVPGRQYTFSWLAKKVSGVNNGLYYIRDATNGVMIGGADYVANLNTSTFTKITATVVAPAGCTELVFYPYYENVPNAGTLLIKNIQVTQANWSGPYVKTLASVVNTGAIRNAMSRTQNILTNSEAFGGSGWGAAQASVNADVAVAPDGTQSADALVETTINSVHQLFQYFANYQKPWVPFAYSCYVKRGTRDWVAFMDGNTGAAVFFDLANGAVGSYVSIGFYNAEIEPASRTIPGAAAGWWRIKAMYAPISVSARRMDIAPATANLGTTYTGVASAEAIYVWGAQAEQRNFVGPYQKTTTPANTSQVRNKNAEKQNLLAYSYDLAATPWTIDGLTRDYGVAESPDGRFRATRLTENNAVGARHRMMYLTLPSQAYKGAGYYTLSGYFHPGTRRYVALYLQDAASSQAIFDLQTGVVVSNTAGTWARIAPAGNGWYRCSLTVYYNLSVGNAQLYMSNGTQIIYNGDGASYLYAWGLQYTFSNRPGAYYETNGSAYFTEELRNGIEPKQNLLTYSEDFTNAAWTKQAGVTVTGNQADPFGSNKACLLDLTAAGGTTGIYQSGGVPGRVHTFSVWMRTVSGTGDILLREGGGTQSVKSLTTTWTRHELTMLLTATGPLWCIQKANANAANQVLIYGAQLTQAGWAGPYQMTGAAKVDYGAIRNLANA